jgi:photosystem II stability/assembly factor-like uncharacterized protein
MADWEGLRGELERGIQAPPLSALRERRKRRRQRKAIAATFAVVLVGSASGAAVLGRAAERERASVEALDKVVNDDALPPPRDYEDPVVTDVDFVSPTTGWALGLRCVGDSCDIVTWRTRDGGRTWEPPTDVARGVPRLSFHAEDPHGGAVRSLRMVDAANGFAFNPDLYRTNDGGVTWHREPQPSKVLSVSATDSSVWLTERGCPVGVDCDVVLRSGTPYHPFSDLEIPETNGAATLIRRAGPEDAYLVTFKTGEPAFHRSLDYGETWTRGRHPCPEATALLLSAGTGRPLWLACTTPDGRRAFTSGDHGSTWRRLADPPAGGELTDLVARSAHDAILTTQAPAGFYVTGDGGATWRPADGPGKGYGYGHVDVVDDKHAWAMGDAGILWRTTDGRRWERLDLPPAAPRASTARGLDEPGVTFYDVSFVDPRHGWAVGETCSLRCRTVVRRTSDGGRSWQPAATLPGDWEAEGDGQNPGQVDRVSFADEKHGWLYGPNVWQTDDGGATWRHLPRIREVTDVEPRGRVVWMRAYDPPAVWRGTIGGDDLAVVPGSDQASLRGGTFVALDEEVAYHLESLAVTDLTDVFSSTHDGGVTWTRDASRCKRGYATLAAHARDRLWLVCGSFVKDTAQTLLRSDDGGRTWRHVPLPGRGGAVGDIVAFSDSYAWRSGANAGLLVTRDGGTTWQAAAVTGKVSALTFTDDRHGWAIADGVLWRTTDGNGWERLG